VTVLCRFTLIILLLAVMAVSAPAAELELRDHDRVVLLGATFIERMQSYGYLETALTARYPHRDLTFRNLGWSADTVGGVSRAVFGKPEDGFKRLMHDVALAKPTVIVIAYGGNEAYDGKAEEPAFRAGLTHLLDALKTLQARLVLVSPPERENLGPPLPDPAEYNASLRRYMGVVREVASERKIPYIELPPVATNPSGAPLADPLDQLTKDGIHRTPYGHWRAAPVIAAQLGHKALVWKIDLDVSKDFYGVTGAAISAVEMSPQHVAFTALDTTLPLSPPPRHSPAGAYRLAPTRIVRVSGLPPGMYELSADGEIVARATAEGWAKGVSLRRGPPFQQVERLRQEIISKNELFFYRHRPQNETYLFLFRKHEQGNNAVEIPQFDPLIKKQEKLIAQLRVPKAVRYELKRAP